MTPRAWRAFAALFLLMMAAAPAVAGAAQRPPSASPSNSVSTVVEEASVRFGLPVSWIEAVIAAESGGDPRAISTKGAMGLMQLMPLTWRELRAELGLGADPWDHHDNIIAGAAYLRQLYDRFGRAGFLAAYNAGPARYQAMLDGGRKLPAETLAYVAAVEARIERSAGRAGRQIPAKPFDWRTADIFAPAWKAPSTSAEPGVMITVIEPTDGAVRP